MPIDYTTELNPAQREAVFAEEGPYLLIAGAGSGKTRVLVYRTARLVERGCPPEGILLLTFTRRAAREMLERASSMLDDRCRRVAGGTFHSFANRVLRRYGMEIGIPPAFTILDQADAAGVLQLLRTRLGAGGTDKRFPRKEALQAILSRSINTGTPIESVVAADYPLFLEWTDAVERLAEEYREYKRRQALLDYDDLLTYLQELLETRPEVRGLLGRRYRYLMVDEYQDTNAAQARIVRLLGGEHGNVMAVGDDAQSIYSFRGGDFRNIMDFPRMFPGTRIIKLEQNYRSSQPILDLTNEIIRSAREKFAKRLFTRNPGAGLPVYAACEDEAAQSRFVVEAVQERLDQGRSLGEIAVLFRSGWHSNDLEVALTAAGIPFAKYGGQKFVEAAHIKDVLSLLGVAFNPQSETHWLRVLTLLKGVGPRTAERIAVSAVRPETPLDELEKAFASKKSLKELWAALRAVRAAASPEEMVQIAAGFYLPYLMERHDDYEKRIHDLDSLQAVASRYETLEDFLTDMALDPPEKGLAAAKGHPSGLTLSTIHSAKGLEWETVFLIHLSEGYLPSYRSLDDARAVEEERRLFYVAATRAKRRLFLLRPVRQRAAVWSGGGGGFTRPSRFLAEGAILSRYVDVRTMNPVGGGVW